MHTIRSPIVSRLFSISFSGALLTPQQQSKYHQRTLTTESRMAEAKEFPPQKIRAIVAEVATLLKEKKESVSVAETAAGGIISASLLSTPGASGFYKGGLTLYTLEARVQFAGWSEDTIKAYKGPTAEIVAGLARSVRGKLGSTYTVSESGTAGPTGGSTPNRTPGYVAVAVATASGTYTREINTELGGNREGNMIQFAVEALTLLRDVIKGDAKL